MNTEMEGRFWAKVDRRGPDECWPWLASGNSQGYGKLYLPRSQGGFLMAHRVSWEIANGKSPGDLLVCHTCDNPPCCNPAHLWLGTSADNLADMSRKGRHWLSGKTHCKQGHEFTPENTRQGRRQRYCRACDRLRPQRRNRVSA